MLWFSCIAIVSCSEMMTAPIAILFSILELSVSHETAITNSQRDFCAILFAFFFSQIAIADPLNPEFSASW